MEMRGVETLLGEVQRRTGLRPPERALRLIRRVLTSLDEVLLDDELGTLRACVPTALREALVGPAGRTPSSVERLFSRVQQLEVVRRPVAIERTEIVCRLLGQMLPPEVGARWSRDLPAPVAALFLAAAPPAGAGGSSTPPRPG